MLRFLISMSSVVNLRSALGGMTGGKPRSPKELRSNQEFVSIFDKNEISRTVCHAMWDNEGSLLAGTHATEYDVMVPISSKHLSVDQL